LKCKIKQPKNITNNVFGKQAFSFFGNDLFLFLWNTDDTDLADKSGSDDYTHGKNP